MPLQHGTKLGSYEILSLIGKGGMGEVYRARDTQLGREVAVKVLPTAVASDSEKIARLEREARLLGAVNHPNIATLHGLEESDGIRFLVMELIEGETLQERIANGPLPVDVCLRLFKQIAEGLEAAHEKGIVHRDIKPANIKIMPDDTPKILDFGLAKAFGPELAGRTASESPTMTREGTETGVIQGTAAYMSPEQARGKTLDKRTDIWSFGCCLFEALTGRAAFLGETVSDTIARILQTEPEWSALPAATARRISELLSRCLAKDAHDRLHDIADARIEISLTLEEPETQRGAVADEKTVLSRTAVFAIAFAVLATGIAMWSLTRKVEPVGRPITRSLMRLPPGQSLVSGFASVAVSPDGRYVAYRARVQDSTRLYLRAVDRLEAVPIEGSDGASVPSFSLDSRWLGFHSGRRIMKVSVNGGAPLTISELAGGDGVARGISWSDTDIVYAPAHAGGLFQVSVDGGGARSLTVPSRERGERSHRFPQVLPGGKATLFNLSEIDTEFWDDGSIAVASLVTGEYRVLLQGGMNAHYVPTGHLVYARSGALYAIAFDIETLEVEGPAVRVVDGVVTAPSTGCADFSISNTGTLVYASGRAVNRARRVISIDRSGSFQTVIENPRPFTALSLSPDGRYLAFQLNLAINNVWVHDLERGTLSRITAQWDNAMPVWAPDSRELIFSSNRSGAWNLFRKSADGTGDAKRLTTSENAQFPGSWSPDGEVLAFAESTGAPTGQDIWILSVEGSDAPEPFLRTQASEGFPAFSPDGRWMAYVSDESGRDEIYLRRYPGASAKRQVSAEGGTIPVWNPDGRELFYRDGDKMMVVSVETGDELVLGNPTMLYERPFIPTFWPMYSVTADGQRFIDVEVTDAELRPTELVIVQNWFQELEQLVPTDN